MSNALSRRPFLYRAPRWRGPPPGARCSPPAAARPVARAARTASRPEGRAARLRAEHGGQAGHPLGPGAAGAFTDPGYLTYPAHPVATVSGIPGKGGSYTAVTPLWGTVPPAGNSFYQAMNKALGVNLTMKPADGNNYATIIPTMTAAKKLPDWIQLPTWWNTNFNIGELVGTQLADLTPYLSGDKIKKYPNLAAIPTGAWQAGAWEDKLYGIPSSPPASPSPARCSTAGTSWRPRGSPPTR